MDVGLMVGICLDAAVMLNLVFNCLSSEFHLGHEELGIQIVGSV